MMSHPLSGAIRPAFTRPAATLTATPAPNDTSSFVRAEGSGRGVAWWPVDAEGADGDGIAPGWQLSRDHGHCPAWRRISTVELTAPCRRRMISAITPVQPVWCEAPSPFPL